MEESVINRETLLPHSNNGDASIVVEAEPQSGHSRLAKFYSSDPNLVSTDNSIRARLRRAMNTHRFQVVIVSMVILDCMVVISELLMDLRILGMIDDWGSGPSKMRTTTQQPPLESQYLIPDILHSISIAILGMFLLETVVKIAAFGLAFLRLGWEIFDAAVITVAFVLDVLLQHSHSSANGLGLIIILRLWRVARILNGMVRSVKVQAVRRVECEKRRREGLEEELLRARETIRRLEDELFQLKNSTIKKPEEE